MNSLLESAWAKIDRAAEHLEGLDGEISRQAKRLRVGGKFDMDRGEYQLFVISIPDIPPRWGAIVGDILHNLRSALDHLAFVGSFGWEDSQFPIVDSPGEIGRNWRFKGTRDRVSSNMWALIERNQPYSGGHAQLAFGHPLARLRDLSNEDKHRTLVGPFMANDPSSMFIIRPVADVELAGGGSQRVGPLKPGTPILSSQVRFTGLNPQMDVEFTGPPHISLSGGGRVQQVMQVLIATVLEIVREGEELL
ncbi:MAG TPA: hypothetical protein VFF07_03235 [Actinomycetota bacterium]|nr:hypothetical protein [Actinomycetota bacterium]